MISEGMISIMINGQSTNSFHRVPTIEEFHEDRMMPRMIEDARKWSDPTVRGECYRAVRGMTLNKGEE